MVPSHLHMTMLHSIRGMQAVTWQDGKPAPYLLIARAFAAMEGTTKRLKKDEIMVDAYRAILQRCPGVVLYCAPVNSPSYRSSQVRAA